MVTSLKEIDDIDERNDEGGEEIGYIHDREIGDRLLQKVEDRGKDFESESQDGQIYILEEGDNFRTQRIYRSVFSRRGGWMIPLSSLETLPGGRTLKNT